jgi:rhodanese-related sulfurtransferase
MQKTKFSITLFKALLILSLSFAVGIAYLMAISDNLPSYQRETPPQQNPKYKEIDLAKAKERFDQGWLFVDARSQLSWKEAHIKGAISFPAGEFLQRISDFEKNYPKDTKMVVYCAGVGCSTSYFLAERLAERGYKNIEVFFGGWSQWVQAGYPTEKGQ